MKAEIIAVGTELLMGQISNTNAQFIAEQLNELGISHYIQTVIGDNPERLIQVTKQAEKRSDIIIYTGGIGPTRDDLTKETLAQYLDEPLAIDEEAWQSIQASFKGRIMVDSNKKMALAFTHGTTLPNHSGQAIGSIIEKGKHIYIILPGPPSEMRPMFMQYVRDYLLEESETKVIKSRFLRFFGIGESLLADKLDDLTIQDNPTVATYASDYINMVRVTASGNHLVEVTDLLETAVKQIKSRVGEYLFAEGKEMTPADALKNYLVDTNQTIGFSESLTGGLASATLVNVPGASKVLAGSIVAYSSQIKHQILGIPQEILDTDGMVSEPCAKAMAESALEKLDTDVAISFTGVAGPGKMEGHKPGTVYVGYAFRHKPTEVIKYQLTGNREAVRKRIIYTAFLHITN